MKTYINMTICGPS